MKLQIHFIELKYRIFFSTITWLTAFIICYTYKEIVTFFLLQYNLPTVGEENCYFITTQLAEAFTVHISIAIFVANQITLLLSIYSLLLFFAPGLYQHEISSAIAIVKIIFFSWFTLSAFFYFILIPISWSFFLNSIEDNISVFFEARLIEYSKFFIGVYYTLNCGGILLALVLYFIYFDSNQIRYYRKARKVIFFVSFFLAAIITPPDIFSQIVVATVFLLIMEIYTASVIFKYLRQPVHTD